MTISFFSRTFMTRRNVITERPFGEVKFKTTAGEDKTAALTFLSGAAVEDKSPKFSDEERKQLEEQLRKIEQTDTAGYVLFPDFSPRRELVEVALQDQESRFLAKNKKVRALCCLFKLLFHAVRYCAWQCLAMASHGWQW